MNGPDDQDEGILPLLVSAMNAREQDGARVSRILHDDVGQVLSAIGLQLDLLRMDLAENLDESLRRIGEIQKILDHAMSRVRDLSYELNPSIVERTGLQFALDRLVGRYQSEFSGNIRLLFDSSIRVPVSVATALYKIAEQAIENAVQHSGASQVEVLVKPSRNGIALEVRDNGTGLPETPSGQPLKGLGLYTMKYYASQAGLLFSVAGLPEKGTIVRAIYRIEKVQADSAAERK